MFLRGCRLQVSDIMTGGPPCVLHTVKKLLTSGIMKGLPSKSIRIQVVFFVTFLLGGGITERNLQRILEGSRAQEFHCSARSGRDSAMKFRWVSTWIINRGHTKIVSTRNQLIHLLVSNRVHRLSQILEQDALTRDLLLNDLHPYVTNAVIAHTGIAP